MNWRGDKTLPWTFIPFLMLLALLIGEVMPVVIGIFGGVFATYGAKEPIIKSLPDFGLVLIIYSVYGFLFWLLYRYINWRVVAVFAFVLAFVLEGYVYWQVPGSVNLTNTVSFETIVSFLIVYFLVLIVPYLIFQAIRHKLKKRGILLSIVIVLALNILGLGFTAYVMLERGLFPWQPVVQQNQSEINVKEYPDLKMVTPYVNESDISSINEAFSSSDNAPWGFKHMGIDFMTSSDLVYFQAVADGTITNLKTSKENEQQGWHTELCIDHRPYLVCYNFETLSSDQADGDRQKESIWVSNGKHVKQGDIIGQLVYGGNGAHVDLGVIQPSKGRYCPEQYFTDDAKASILRLIHKDHPTWSMCYE